MKDTRHSRTRVGDDSDQRTNGWQIVYTGFVLILLCFFIMLTSFASLNQSKITQFSRAFSHAVSVFNSGQSLEKGRTMIQDGAMVVEKEDEMAKLFEKIRQLGRDSQLEQVEMTRRQRGIVLTLSEKLLFPSADDRLMTDAYSLLEKVGGIIRDIDGPVEIEGHTDDQPIRNARFASNWDLSTARAVTVLRYMIEKQHADSRLISAVGFSKYQPVVPNDSMANRARNRRVEIIFKTKGSS